MISYTFYNSANRNRRHIIWDESIKILQVDNATQHNLKIDMHLHIFAIYFPNNDAFTLLWFLGCSSCGSLNFLQNVFQNIGNQI